MRLKLCEARFVWELKLNTQFFIIHSIIFQGAPLICINDNLEPILYGMSSWGGCGYFGDSNIFAKEFIKLLLVLEV